ncbi:Major sperm protein [Penicillium robsamsonii]|uniref:Major sperm protein n=1 Tax=Penicillium robsamsonii TaxID=1792511 RepID=UPI0025499D29|nr:Major sperm protein [Penicillium robsamsonii]KAJ5811081.1 Major sperm protein [Penicillium robsamsonii]
MTIQIEPSELGFKRPFNHEVCQVLRLSNPNEESVVFKVKTTAPKHYCVRPNSGHIQPGKTVEVQVLLQAMKEDPAADAKCKDKFLVQAVPVSRGLEDASVGQIFDQTPKADVVERKIRVVYLATDAAPANDSVHDEEPPAYTSPAGANFQTPAPKKIESDEPSPIPAPDFSEKKSLSPQGEPASVMSNARSAVANALPSSDELKSQLSEANAQIQRLKDRLADQGLRQRKTGGEATGTAVPATMQQSQAPTAGGVSIQGVACLCLLSFLIAYFFF